MFPMLIGFGSALLFGLFAYGTYGAAGLIQHSWVGIVFLALMGNGLLVFLLNREASQAFRQREHLSRYSRLGFHFR
jgi:hypothetical protein